MVTAAVDMAAAVIRRLEGGRNGLQGGCYVQRARVEQAAPEQPASSPTVPKQEEWFFGPPTQAARALYKSSLRFCLAHAWASRVFGAQTSFGTAIVLAALLCAAGAMAPAPASVFDRHGTAFPGMHAATSVLSQRGWGDCFS